jgi:hypothetical protein
VAGIAVRDEGGVIANADVQLLSTRDPMKPEEESAAKFLNIRFKAEPVYEPLGASKPPDFAIGRTAFEVRRLNQRYFHGDGTHEALEHIDFRLGGAIYGEFSKIAFSEERGTFFWGLDFKRPLQDEPGSIARQLAKTAREYYGGTSREHIEIKSGNVTLDIFASDHPLGFAFVPGYRGDDDSGGCFGAIYPASICLAVTEKIAKTEAIAAKFKHWGLVLIDDIGHGMLEPNDLGKLDLRLQHFDSVAIINWNGSLALEWPEGSLSVCEP